MKLQDLQKLAQEHLVKEQLDVEFLPYLKRINSSEYAITVECCAGHMRYVSNRKLPVDNTGRYGYIYLFVHTDLANYLHMIAQYEHWDKWLWIEGSRLDHPRAKQPKKVMDTLNWWEIAFNWDAKYQLEPAGQIASAIERFTEKKQNEQRQSIWYTDRPS